MSVAARTSLILQNLASSIADILRDTAGEELAFVLIVSADKTAQYVSNASRKDGTELIESLLTRWKAGRADIPAHYNPDIAAQAPKASPAVSGAERLAQVMALSLERGNHEEFEGGMCVMEAVSYVAGEPWSDAPSCASPVITAFLVAWNDSLDDEPRNRLLKPLIPLLVGTRASSEVEERRSYMALDWLIRVFTPKWLDLVPSLHEHAKALRELDAIIGMAGAAAAGEQVRSAWAAAAATARAAAGDAAWAAAATTAGAAAGDAAWDAADAAGDAAAAAAAAAAARNAAWDAARAAAWAAPAAAAWAAAGAAAGAALKPTTEWLQTSAVALVHRMLEAA